MDDVLDSHAIAGLKLHTILGALLAAWLASADHTSCGAPPDYQRDVAPILAKYCAGCHNDEDREGDLSLQSFAGLKQGGEHGAVLVPGRAEASRLIRVLTGEIEPAMPPEDNPRPAAKEIDLLRAWIDSGALGPEGAEPLYPELTAPDIAPKERVRGYLTCLALSPSGQHLALGGYRRISLVELASEKEAALVEPLAGKVNSLGYSRDGSLLVATSGIPGLYGVATICRAESGEIVSQIKGHRDAMYDGELSPDGKLLATCSYDRQVNLWDVDTSALVRSFAGHTGAVFDLAFSPDGTILASASADGTVKVWHVASGGRLDTLSQPEGEQYAVAFAPDGTRIVAGGADRQLRMWQLVSREQPAINPLEFSRAGHDSPISRIAFSPDGSKIVSAGEGGDVIVWSAAKLLPTERLEQQSDSVTGLAFDPSGKSCYIASLDGSWRCYSIDSPKTDKLAAQTIDGLQVSEDESQPPDLAPPMAASIAEQEPNNSPSEAGRISLPAVIHGVIGPMAEDGEADVDLFRFHARNGQRLVLEMNAARQKSPLDSRLEVLDAAGNPVPRVVLQAVRKSYFTFRGADSNQINDFRLHGWQDMELNEYVYATGEVVKLWLYPRGPDSGFIVYPGFSGNRYAYFGTTPLAHALNETCYIVEPHPPGSALIPNGLPQFTLYYENDDDGWRKLGADSRLAFTAPADGEFLVRVSDVRGFGGEDYRYELTIRPPAPDFQIKLSASDLTIHPGGGKEFMVEAERIDEFDGEIRVEVTGLPPGFHASSPLVIQAGQTTAYGTITADANAPPPTPENATLARVTASAMVHGRQIEKEPSALGELKLGGPPSLQIEVVPDELFLSPGETITAVVRVQRNGFEGDVGFGNEYSGRNLPHGVYIDNIGLNGLTLLAGESERTFFITAAKWVPETTRTFHLRAQVEGNPTSKPVTLHIRKRSDVAQRQPQ